MTIGRRLPGPPRADPWDRRAACYDWHMVQMYVWLVLAVVLAVGVLVLAHAATREDTADRPAGDRPRTLAAAVHQTWLDFRSGATTLRSRVRSLGRGSSTTGGGTLGAPTAARAGSPARVPVLAGARTPLGRGDAGRPADAWSSETPQDTTIDDFFAATQTSGPAYLDTAEMSDVLHRRR